MPDYEELYNIARNKYNQAIENRNEIRNKTSELQERRNSISREMEQKQSVLHVIQQKKVIVQEAEDACQEILNHEFPDVKKHLQTTSVEYEKIITTDSTVADIEGIYADDIRKTQNELEAIWGDLVNQRKKLEEQEANAQREVENCNNQLEQTNSALRNVGSEAYAQRQINNCYAEMKVYEYKWQNGD